MKVLLFGAAGQLGRALHSDAPDGVELVAVTRADGDLAEPGTVERLIAQHVPTRIINASAYTAVDAAETDELAARILNRDVPEAMAKAAQAAGARLLHVSTDYVFDGASSRPYRPDGETNPQGVYGRTKRDGEDAVLSADPDALVVRTSWVYGAQGANFLKTMLRLGDERERLGVIADQIGTPTSVSSLASAVWQLAACDASGILHYSDSGIASWYDFAVAIFEEAVAAGLIDTAPQVAPIATADYPTPAPRPAYSVLEKSDTVATLGWTPAHWRVELRKVIGELKKNG